MKYAIIDIETTGGSFKTGRITEVAIFLHSGSKLEAEYSTLINPEVPIPPFVAKLTGITNKMVAGAPTFAEVAPKLLEITAGAYFVAHNANFDYSFLKEEFRKVGMEFKRKRLCTVQLSRRAFPGLASYSLDKITGELGISLNGHHRARIDALATLKLFEMILEAESKKPLLSIEEPLPDLTGINSPLISKEILQSIPDECGVYTFFDVEDQPIFIKRSDNMLTSICERLANVEAETIQRMRRDLYRVEYTETGSALLAQLIEADQVLRNRPLYNRNKFSLKADYGVYLLNGNAGHHLVLSKTRHDDPALIYFSNFYEGLDYLKFKAKEWDTQVIEAPLRSRMAPGIFLGPDEENYPQALISGHYVIEDEGRSIDEKTLILVEDGLPRAFGYFDANLPMTRYGMSDYQYDFGNYTELEMVVRRFVQKKRFERIIRLDD